MNRILPKPNLFRMLTRTPPVPESNNCSFKRSELRRSTISRVLEFPEGLSPATSGVLVEKGRTLITGHANGHVARWSLGSTSQPVIILRAASTVYALATFPGDGLFVGSQAGDLHLIENV